MALVDVGPIQQAVLTYVSNGGSYSEICKDLGWVRGNRCETNRLKISLGLIPNGEGKVGKRITVENATLIARTIGADPVDVGV